MRNVEKMQYNIAKDVAFILDADKRNIDEFSSLVGISRTTLYEILKKHTTTPDVMERFYDYVYRAGYRLNVVKEELLKESQKGEVLFHGSRKGLKKITESGSRDSCDFGNGFYLSEAYEPALSFVCESEVASVYSFRCDFQGLRIETFGCSLDWMLAICNFRGTIREYTENKIIKKIKKRVEAADVIVAPIADNKMFYIMSQFAAGDINADVAMHSLSASRLGQQYVFKTKQALNALIPIEKYYLCRSEKEDCEQRFRMRGAEIETKLKLAKREYKKGLYIEELLK